MPRQNEFSLITTRKELGLGQVEMAKRMGLSLRPYQELETKERKLRPRHIRLAESVALDIAFEKQDLDLAPAKLRISITRLIQLKLKERAFSVAECIVGKVDKLENAMPTIKRRASPSRGPQRRSTTALE